MLTGPVRMLGWVGNVLRAYHVGPDLGLAGGNFEFAVVADFDDLEGYQVYQDNRITGRSSGSSSSR